MGRDLFTLSPEQASVSDAFLLTDLLEEVEAVETAGLEEVVADVGLEEEADVVVDVVVVAVAVDAVEVAEEEVEEEGGLSCFLLC